MSLLRADSFDHIQKSDVVRKWSSVPSASMYDILAGAGRCGSQCLSMNDGACIKGVSPATTGGWGGIAVKTVSPSGALSSNQPIWSVYQSGNTALTWYRAIDGSVWVRRPDGLSPILLATGGDMLRVGVFDYAEFLWTIHASAGMVAFRPNADPLREVIVTGINTLGVLGGTGWSGVGVGASIGSLLYYDDFVVGDTAGAAPWNTWLGNVQVEWLEQNGPGSVTDWLTLVGAATQWQATLDAAAPGPDDAASYIADDAAGTVSTFTIAEPGAVVGVDVFGLQVTMCGATVTPGSRAVAAVVREGGVNYPGDDLYLTSGPDNFAMVQQMFQANPATGLQWAMAEVQADEIGVELSV